MKADKDIILAKAGTVKRCLKRIRETTGGDPNSLDNFDVQDVVTLNLQRAIQAATDIAAHIISTEECELPRTMKEHFEILCRMKIIDADLAGRMSSMVGFRNVAVHDYQSLNLDVVRRIVTERLGDFDSYVNTVLMHI